MMSAPPTILIFINSLILVSCNKVFRLLFRLFRLFLVVKIIRLEQLCKEQGQKVPLRLKNSVTTFSLDLENLNPLSPSLECHIEVSTHQPNSGKVKVLFSKDKEVIVLYLGFFVFFSELNIAENYNEECSDDFVQFGRDIMFLTSYR